MATEADILNALNLGTAKSVIEGKPNSPLGLLLTELSNDVVKQLQSSMDKYDISASHNLRQSIKPQSVETSGDMVSVSISADFYWKYVNYGVNGFEVNHGAPRHGKETQNTGSFHANIMEGMRARGIVAPSSFSSFESYAWAAIGKIRRDGIKKRPFFTDVVNKQLTEYLKEPISKLLKKSITVTIIEPWQ